KGCGFEGKTSPFSFKGNIGGKLPWKIEWAVKWKVVGITVEGAGKDHMSSGGSHDLASLVCNRIIDYPVPYPLPYEFFLVGDKKMSSSKGLGSTASEMLETLPPEVLRFLMVKTRLNQAINFDPSGDTIPKLFDEFQLAALEHKGNKNTDLRRIFELSQVGKLKYPPTLRFQNLTQWVQMPNMEEEIKKEGLEEWVPYAKNWVERFASEDMKYKIQEKIPEKAKKLSAEQKKYLAKVLKFLDKDWEAEEFQKKLYECAKESGVSSKEAFRALYLSLLGKDYGPKAAWIILKEDRGFIKQRFKEASK
ncbi:MAG TPA: lysine--tRNA ligase, partial [Candidatus Nanoarchaeia archaeon]|nr:lysine--tRNA ligase [Candidatus Nanoarchaeia archaeon]